MKPNAQYKIQAKRIDTKTLDGISTTIFAKKYGRILYILVFSSFKNISLSTGTNKIIQSIT